MMVLMTVGNDVSSKALTAVERRFQFMFHTSFAMALHILFIQAAHKTDGIYKQIMNSDLCFYMVPPTRL